MAHKKGQGSSKNGRDSQSKRLGVKIYGGQVALAGNIIVRQRGTQFHVGKGVGIGRDHTIFSKIDGIVTFEKKRQNRTYISVLPLEEEEVTITPSVKTATAEMPEATSSTGDVENSNEEDSADSSSKKPEPAVGNEAE